MPTDPRALADSLIKSSKRWHFMYHVRCAECTFVGHMGPVECCQHVLSASPSEHADLRRTGNLFALQHWRAQQYRSTVGI